MVTESDDGPSLISSRNKPLLKHIYLEDEDDILSEPLSHGSSLDNEMEVLSESELPIEHLTTFQRSNFNSVIEQ
jgi:hypothetical protein